jgi:hypothetical protein
MTTTTSHRPDRTKTGPTPKREAQRQARRRPVPVAERRVWNLLVYGLIPR